MHCSASENQIYTVSLRVFKRSRKPTAEKSTSEYPRRKRPIFVVEIIFVGKYGI